MSELDDDRFNNIEDIDDILLSEAIEVPKKKFTVYYSTKRLTPRRMCATKDIEADNKADTMAKFLDETPEWNNNHWVIAIEPHKDNPKE